MNGVSFSPLMHLISMKKIIAAIALIVLCTTSYAQEKKLTNNFMMGAGLFLETGTDTWHHNPGAVVRLSYGLDIPIEGSWSLMPGAGIRMQMSDIAHIGWCGGDGHALSYADVFCVARYHTEDNGQKVIFGIGPQLSIVTLPDTYYIDADPMDPLNNKETFKRYDLGLQPSVIFLKGKHWQWGFEASIGLLNAMVQYPEMHHTGSIHLHNVMIVGGWRF